MTQDANKTFLTPKIEDPGNFVNDNAFNIGSMDLDAGLSPVVA